MMIVMDAWGWGAAITAFVAGTILPTFAAFTSWLEGRSSRRRAKDDVELYLSMPEGTPGRVELGRIVEMQMSRRLNSLTPGYEELLRRRRRLRWWGNIVTTFPLPGGLLLIPFGVWTVSRPEFPDNALGLYLYLAIFAAAVVISLVVGRVTRGRTDAIDGQIAQLGVRARRTGDARRGPQPDN
ncbi:hypothetical protein [Kineococcus rhizosphaerae]|nr:hypothetical protein [Kineococcus rhizosphaerae]